MLGVPCIPLVAPWVNAGGVLGGVSAAKENGASGGVRRGVPWLVCGVLTRRLA